MACLEQGVILFYRNIYVKRGERFVFSRMPQESIVDTLSERKEMKKKRNNCLHRSSSRYVDMERSSSSFSLISHFPTLKRHLHNDAPSVGQPSLNATRPSIQQRSIVAIPRVTPSKMQQANQSNLHEAGLGVPSRLCSVCGDISTGTFVF